MKKHVIMALVASSVAVGPVTRAAADAGDFVAGALIGGVVGAAINHNMKTKKRTVYRTAPAYSATRAQNAQVQTALNYFGFPAGTPDGSLGPRSRGAISSYQVNLGYPATGYLTDYQQNFLLSSYQRAQAGGAYVMQQVATTPGGVQGVLKQWHNEAMGIPTPGTTMAAAPVAPMPAIPAAPETSVVVPAAPEPAAPATTMAAAPEPAVPNFLGGGGDAQMSLASHCNKVSLMTSTNGGFTTLATMTDPGQTLDEQFCLARTYAIATGEELAQKVQGFTPAQIAEQCAGIGDAMTDTIDSVGYDNAGDVLKSTNAFIRQTGMAAGQLEATGKICLSVGYRTDDLQTALGSALLLTALGQQPYAELIGHSLEFGIGAAQRADLAQAWYEMAIQSLESGTPAVFAPGQPERTKLIKAAVFGGDNAPSVVPTTAAPAAPGKIPGFGIKN